MSPSPETSTDSRGQPLVGDHVTWPADVILHPDHPVAEAAERMREKGRSFAPVVDGDAIVGVLSLGLLADADDGRCASVFDCMTPTVPFLYHDDPLALADAIALQTGIRHFCVVDRDHLLLGILALSDARRDDLPPTVRVQPMDPQEVRRRLAVTPGRASSSEFGDLGSYAEGPTLYTDGRSVREPRDQPMPALRRNAAMKTKL